MPDRNGAVYKRATEELVFEESYTSNSYMDIDNMTPTYKNQHIE